MAVSGADVLLDAFRNQGIETIFCSPGSEHFPIWESLARRTGQGDTSLKYVNCRHEVLAVSMAVGYAQVTGRLTAVLLHAGVGPLNAAMAIRVAFRDRTPVIICSGDTADYGEGSDDRGDCWKWLGTLSELGGTDALMRTYVKWAGEVKSKDTLYGHVANACRIARATPQGPTFLVIPWEFLYRDRAEVNVRPSRDSAELPAPRREDLDAVADRLLASRNPIILTEHAGKEPGAVPRLVELAELLGIPVLESIYPRFANFPREHPLHLGYDASRIIHEADAILIAGGITPWQPPSMRPRSAESIILVDPDTTKSRLPYWGYPIDLAITADIGPWLGELAETVRGRLRGDAAAASLCRHRFEQWREQHDRLWAGWKAQAAAGKDRRPLSPAWFLHRAAEVLPENAYILTEAATHSALVQRYMARPNSFYKVITGGLGMGLGEAAGTRLALPDRPVVFVVGDGSFAYSPVLAGFGVCQEYGLPILTIVLNNAAYAAMKSIHQKYYPDGWSARQNRYYGVDLAPVPDYVKVGQAFDAWSERIDAPDAIEPALRQALKCLSDGRSALLDVILDPEDTGGYAAIGLPTK